MDQEIKNTETIETPQETTIDNTEDNIKEEEGIKESKEEGKPRHKILKGEVLNPNGRPKGSGFSLKNDLIKSLKRIRKNNPALYKEIIDSYWKDPKMRMFLLEIVDGKARQSMEMSGDMQNPIRVIKVQQMEVINNAPSINP